MMRLAGWLSFVWIAAIGLGCSGSSDQPGSPLAGGAGGTADASLLCIPGQSVACVGPGACQGGQVCSADGRGYGPCACGSGGGGGAGGSVDSGGKTGSGGAFDAGSGGTTGSGGAFDAGSGGTFDAGSGGAFDAGSGGAFDAGSDGDAEAGGSLPGWTNVTSNLADMASECGNVGFVSAKPDIDMLVTGIAKKGLWSSTDGGAHWTALGTGAGSDAITNRAQMVVYDPVAPTTWWEAGTYNGGGVYKTTDDGVTWKRLGSITNNDSVAIDFTDPSRKTLLAGGHEQMQTLWKSTDGGQSWTNIGLNIPAGYSFPSNAFIVDAQTYVVGCAGFSGTAATLRTTDGGASWTNVSNKGPAPAPLVASGGTVYWPFLWDNGLLASDDKGLTWTTPLTEWNTLASVALVELPDHRLAGVSGGGNMVPQFVVISTNGGKYWTKVGPQIPFKAMSVTYSVQRKAFYVSYLDCGASVPSDAIETMPFDYMTQ
jgi:hypothetical protein